VKSSMDAFCLCFELQKALVGLGLAAQRDRLLQEPPVLRLEIFLDHLLDPRALFCRMGRLDEFRLDQRTSEGYAELSPIAQPGSVGGATLHRSAFPRRPYRAQGSRSAVGDT
jgi:hypothetical protein